MGATAFVSSDMSDFRLPYFERLRSFGAVRRLFTSGRGGFVYPFRYVVFAEPDSEFSAEVLFTVPKKNHKRANVRNLLRRRTKEAYRLNKALIHDSGKCVAVDMAFIYSSREVVDYRTIEYAVRRILENVAADL